MGTEGQRDKMVESIEQNDFIGADRVVRQADPQKIISVCQDIQELYQLYEKNWFDLEGNRVPILSATLQMINRDIEVIDIVLFLQMDDVTENAIYQQVAESMTVKEANAVYEFSRSAINCSLSMIAVE